MDAPEWFRPRGYMHFDVPVGVSFAKSISRKLVRENGWSPLIHYMKEDKRYKPLDHKTIKKPRPIMYASHRDACILALYSYRLSKLLDRWYKQHGLHDSVVAYRSLGKGNYDFARRVQDYVQAHENLTVMCFDVTGFFDNLEHEMLKRRLKLILKVTDLPEDWFKVYRYVTKYRYVNLSDLRENDEIKKRLDSRKRIPIASIPELKAAGIEVRKHDKGKGIPQGTPISATLSNLYMTDFDLEMLAETIGRDGLYQRYSDDILIACPPAKADELEALVKDRLNANGLELQTKKTERKTFSGQRTLSFQYLGYQLGQGEALIRPGSLSRQWRTARRAIVKAERAGVKAIASGKANKVFTKKLHNKFNNTLSRNFISYANRSGDKLASNAIKRQLKRMRKHVATEMVRLKS